MGHCRGRAGGENDVSLVPVDDENLKEAEVGGPAR